MFVFFLDPDPYWKAIWIRIRIGKEPGSWSVKKRTDPKHCKFLLYRFFSRYQFQCRYIVGKLFKKLTGNSFLFYSLDASWGHPFWNCKGLKIILLQVMSKLPSISWVLSKFLDQGSLGRYWLSMKYWQLCFFKNRWVVLVPNLDANIYWRILICLRIT